MNAQPVLHKQVLEAGGPLAYARPSKSSARRVVDNHCVMTGRPGMRQCRCVPEMREAPTCKVVPRGLEPRTLRLLAVRSNQLSYETSCMLPDMQGINAAQGVRILQSALRAAGST